MTIQDLYNEYAFSHSPNPGILDLIQEHITDIEPENVDVLQSLKTKLRNVGFQDLADKLD